LKPFFRERDERDRDEIILDSENSFDAHRDTITTV